VSLAYEPARTIAHRLDPRSKLAVQLGFATAAFAHTTSTGLAVLTVLCWSILWLARTSPWRALSEYRFVLVLLTVPVFLEALVIGPPWISLAAARTPALASYRVLLVLFVSAAYLRTTPIRDSEAAIRWALPGRLGRVLGTGTALVVRFMPVLRADLGAMRRAMTARLGDQRPVTDRIRLLALGGVARTTERADRLALAMSARCFAWNPTLPALSFSPPDYATLALAVALLAWAFV
jgi:biotin transport system permease protein